MNEPETPVTLEPDGNVPLYGDVPFDDWVDTTPCEFDYAWLVKATLKTKGTVRKHILNGSFGRATQIKRGTFLFSDGHRAICRFNNNRYKSIAKYTVIDDDDMRIHKKQDKDAYDKDAFIAIRKHSTSEVERLAKIRVEDESENYEKMATISRRLWHGVKKGTPEYEKVYNKQIAFYSKIYENEIVLLRRTGSDGSKLKKALDLPPSILADIDGRLSVTQAQYFIEEYLTHESTSPEQMKNPIYRFRIVQAILEQINMQHLRDVQILGASYDKDNEGALKESITRYNAILPKEGAKKSSNEPLEPEESPVTGAPDESHYK